MNVSTFNVGVSSARDTRMAASGSLKDDSAQGEDRQLEGVDFFETFAPVVNWKHCPTIDGDVDCYGFGHFTG